MKTIYKYLLGRVGISGEALQEMEVSSATALPLATGTLKKATRLFMLCCIAVSVVQAQVSLPKVLGHNMVLQRNKPVAIWGTASAGEEVTVSFDKQVKKTIASDSGKWQVLLDAMPASDQPAKMTIKGHNEIVLQNILVGEVWLCSGQSNMEYTMRRNSKVTIPAGITDWPVNELEVAKNPAIRIFLVDRKKMSSDPAHMGWSIAKDSALRSFSAVGYFFAKKLYEELQVPIGMISSAVPGSRIEPWAPKEAFTALPYFQNITDSTHQIEGEPGKFYQTMIAPLSPFTIKGFLWYQGESNCFLKETLQYTYKMQALINQWRSVWNDAALPFYYVAIAPFEYSASKGKLVLTPETLPEFWEAQAMALKIPHTAMVVTTDLNDSLNNLHPHYKWEVGRRLALYALAKAYGKRGITVSGPVFKSMQMEGNKAIIDFNYVETGLISKNGKPLNCFTVAGVDGKFVTADAVLKGDQVIVSSPLVEVPKAVRFGWNEADHSNLFNADGLPAMPFRTDNPLEGKFK